VGVERFLIEMINYNKNVYYQPPPVHLTLHCNYDFPVPFLFSLYLENPTNMATKAHMPKAMNQTQANAAGGQTLKAHEPKALNVTKEHSVFLVELGWTVKGNDGKQHDLHSFTLTGSVDLDASCLLFDKWGRWVETVFWDNLQTRGVEHKGKQHALTLVTVIRRRNAPGQCG
jgi:hypothetical protein